MKYAIVLSVLMLSACAGMAGKEYSVQAYNSRGQLLNKQMALDSSRSGIPIARDSLCKTCPNATIRVYNNITKQELGDMSPYSCKR